MMLPRGLFNWRCGVSALLLLIFLASRAFADTASSHPSDEKQSEEQPKVQVEPVLLEGILATNSLNAYVIPNERLPHLAHTNTSFTITLAVFLTASHTGSFRGIFWKGEHNAHRTPSMWLLPEEPKVTFRLSTTTTTEAWGTSQARLPVGRWCHLAVASRGDGLVLLYVDGVLDIAISLLGAPVGNDGPLWLGRDKTMRGMEGAIAKVSLFPRQLAHHEVAQTAANALASLPQFAAGGVGRNGAALGGLWGASVERAHKTRALEVANKAATEFMLAVTKEGTDDPPSAEAAAAEEDGRELTSADTEKQDVESRYASDTESDTPPPHGAERTHQRAQGVGVEGIEEAGAGGVEGNGMEGAAKAPGSGMNGEDVTAIQNAESAAPAGEPGNDKIWETAAQAIPSDSAQSSVNEGSEEWEREDHEREEAAESPDAEIADDGAVCRATEAEEANDEVAEPGEMESVEEVDLELEQEEIFLAAQELEGAEDYYGALEDELQAEQAMSRTAELYEKAAERGHAGSLSALGHMWAGGYGTAAPSEEKAVFYYLQAAAAGDIEAWLALAHRHANGYGVPRSCAAALLYAEQAAEVAHEEYKTPGGQRRVEAVQLSEDVAETREDHRGDDGDRSAYLQNAADMGDPHAAIALANAHYWGNFGLPRDHTRAFQYFRRAHQGGLPDAGIGVAKMLLKGEGVEKNVTEALRLYNLAADTGSADALNGLGYLYYNGDKVESNMTTALGYFRRAAALGSVDAMVNAGLMLRAGRGCDPDFPEAYRLFSQGAASGHFASLYYAGKLESSGAPGVAHSCPKALRHLLAAAQTGPWARVLQRGLSHYLAGKPWAALRAYSRGAELGYPVATYNAAWLHDRVLASARLLHGGSCPVLGNASLAARSQPHPPETTVLGDLRATAKAAGADAAEAERGMAHWAVAMPEGGDGSEGRPPVSPVRSEPGPAMGAAQLPEGVERPQWLRSVHTAARFFRRVQEQFQLGPNVAWAALKLGDCQYYGVCHGCQATDVATAAMHYERAGNLGEGQGYFSLAVMYLQGFGAVRSDLTRQADLNRAEVYFEKAHALGQAPLPSRLALWFIRGVHVWNTTHTLLGSLFLAKAAENNASAGVADASGAGDGEYLLDDYLLAGMALLLMATLVFRWWRSR
ncbi:hypothetical protein CYMTET_7010 [Cymbomonas tetramitiformis]|uniref:Uncharacterized protein n=1 Tax=Cymbomonas tetramitiformis TaxID=36881 RepID=A0AAE0GWG5_9CHLO|nr:hypothetical protein CYMTET_7010 [Cymbomonas tetramitiformis]